MCRRGDIYFADLGDKQGSSIQRGLRPVLIVSNDVANRHSPVITMIPLTGRVQKKRTLPTHVFIPQSAATGLDRASVALAEQVTSIDKGELLEFKGRVTNPHIMEAVDQAIKIQLGVSDRTQ